VCYFIIFCDVEFGFTLRHVSHYCGLRVYLRYCTGYSHIATQEEKTRAERKGTNCFFSPSFLFKFAFSPSQTQAPKGQWTCLQCTYMNQNNEDNCLMCECTRESQSDYSYTTTSSYSMNSLPGSVKYLQTFSGKMKGVNLGGECLFD
jgi:hypothetical protein